MRNIGELRAAACRRPVGATLYVTAVEKDLIGRHILAATDPLRGVRLSTNERYSKPTPDEFDCARWNMLASALAAPESAVIDARPKSHKVQLLEDVIEIVGQRGLNYGTPEDNFERIVRRWNVHLVNRYGVGRTVPLDTIDVAQMCVDLKQARIENEPYHLDSWKDIAGYAACGGEIAHVRKQLDTNGTLDGNIPVGEAEPSASDDSPRQSEEERIARSSADAATKQCREWGV